jgi:thiol:disulfide interchange protein DsbD
MRAFLSFFGLIISFCSFGQILNPVKWSIELRPESKGEYTLVAKATIQDGWWVYSQYLGRDDGPIATTITYDPGTHYKLVGKNKESDNAKKGWDKFFEMDVTKFTKYYTIEQKIKVADPSIPITGYLNFMTCNDDRCLPPTDIDFSLIPPGSSGDAGDKEAETKTTQAKKSDQDALKKAEPALEKKKLAENTKKDSASTSTFSNVNLYNPPAGGTDANLFQPVKWIFRSEKKSEGLFEIIAEATIEDNWHIYGPGTLTDDGPVPTSFLIDVVESYTAEGTVKEHSTGRIEGHDRYFDMNLVKYKHDARLSQMVKTSNPSIVSGSLEFMACDETKCLAPEYIEFKVDLASGLQFVDNTLVRPTVDEQGVIDQTIPIIQSTFANPLSDCGTTKEKKSNLLWMFIFGFGGGLLALLTPCVFPMIPLTVSFFTKDTKRKGWQNGLWYGASIMIIYVALGILLTLVFGATALNDLSTNAVANTLFFVIFVFFAFSFFGYYEITLPSSWSNKSDAMADKGGLLGIFFMAATLAIVSFSCTGPLIGSALVEASSEGTLGPAIVMAGFSLALAIPFGLFAIFPAWLNSLPKSGGWMTNVKVMLGFLELALAFKFLSVADMASHWGILRYELFMGLWVIISILMAMYMFGIIRFPHDNKRRRLSPIPSMIGIFFLAFGLYLATSFFRSETTGTYNALSIMSGLAPPAHYNFFVDVKDLDANLKAQYESLTKCANNFDCFHDYYEGIAYAKQQNKPILLDFTGYGCVNCRKTEEHIWVKEEVRRKISEDFVLVSLYVDDKEPLDSTIFSVIQNKKMRRVGDIWSDFQITNFKQNSQPLYVLMTPDQQVLTAPRGYDPDADAYDLFLTCGLNAFRELNAPVIGDSE